MSNPGLPLVNRHPLRAVLFRLFRGPGRIADVVDLGLAVGVSEKTAERWTNGQAEPDFYEVVTIVQAFPETERDIAAVLFPGKSVVDDAKALADELRELETKVRAARQAIEGNG